MSLPSPPRWVVWATLIGAGIAYEIHELLDGPDGVPLSKVIRRVFYTHTPTGKALFTISVEQGAEWLIRHITEGTTTT